MGMTFQSMQLQAKAPPSQALSLTPVRTNLLQRKCACGGTPGVDGECTECRRKRLALQRRSTNQTGLSIVPPIVQSVPGSQGQLLDQATRNFKEPRFGHDFSQVRVHTTAPRKVQTKLSIGRSGDSYEQEADMVAEQVSAARLPQTKGSPVVLQLHPGDEGGGVGVLVTAQHDLPTISPLVQREQHAWGEESLEAKSTDVEQSLSAPDAPSMIDSLEGRLSQNQGSGSPLPEPTRRFMENRFGVDFGNVRVHINVEASQMNDTLQSLAFTHGQNIYFASGMYNPGTQDGDKLLAHELTHTVQQSGGSEAAAVRPHSTTHIQRFERKPYRNRRLYRGKNVHTIIERILRADKENPGLITEAPIPGGTTKAPLPGGGTALDVVGSADLYKSSDEGYVSGVRGEYPKEEHHREESQRELVYKPLNDARALSVSGPAKSRPTIVAKGPPFSREFPEKFWVADLKPLDVTKTGKGTAQIGNYIAGFPQFIARAHADKMVSRGTSTGDKLTGLHIPQGLDYSRFDVESSSIAPGEGNFIAGPERYWLYEIPNLGLYFYFTLPHPYQATKRKEAIDKVFAALRKVTAGLRKGKKSIDTDPGIVTRKCRSSITGPPVHRMKRPLPARRNIRSTIQCKG